MPSSESTFPMLMTPLEVAHLLRTTPKAIYTKFERGQLPGAIKVGRRLLVRSRVLLDSLGDHKSAPSPKE